ncbi:hypothetical protein [Treponema sp.]|uniref:hypothetical protein n=1 Tax=Treponema sp. TaxID=166 RepID=UPI00298ECB7B|nr:hypothetical protein [Treponema sp.]MCR5612137.1 hypothetical protein [Treponema sp.]
MKRQFFKTTLAALTTATLLCAGASADELDNFGDFGSDSGESKGVSVNGKAALDVRAFIDNGGDAEKLEMKAIPQSQLGFEYKGKISDSSIQIKLNEDIIKNHPIDVVDELAVKGYFNWFTVEAGKMKVVWGKGDKLHVIDNFNADDYTDFIIPDYIDRRVSTPMIKLGADFGVANLHLEGVYTPLLPVDRFAKSGRWTPAAYSTLSGTVKTSATTQVASAFSTYTQDLAGYSQYVTALGAAGAAAKLNQDATTYMTSLTNANSLNANPDSIYPDMMTLKYGQFGARLTGSAGPVDFGVSYYNGYYKQPSCNASKINSYVAKQLAGTATEDDKFLAYDKKQTFGVEAAAAVWHFNLRGEFAYNLTDDVAGTDPWVHNNSIAWLGGFDIDLPFWNMNVNIQETGTYILNGNECDKNALDVDYSKTGYSNNKVVANLSASFVNDKVVPEVTVVYGIEKGDVAVLPKISYKLSDGLTLYGSGLYLWSKDTDSEFYAWRNNSFVNLGAVYQF